MEPEFWHSKWQKNEIGFHLSEANPLLVAHFESLSLAQGSRIFLPLCGKTVDIGWLLSRACQVVGVELNRMAVEQLFEALNIEPEISEEGGFTIFRAENIQIFVGDFFELSAMDLGAIDAIYDRAALIALPESMRQKYADHLMVLTQCAKQLLITLTYDQALMPGPPFSVSEEEVAAHYQGAYRIGLLCDHFSETGLKGKHPAYERVWLLQTP